MRKSPSTIQEDSRFRVLRLLNDNPAITQRELADRLGISLGATNYLLQSLLKKGAIKVQNFQASPRKLAYAYILTPKGIADKSRLTAGFLKRKLAEYEALRAEIEAVSQEVDEDAQGVKPN